VPAPTLSFHLSALEAAGLVAARRGGRSIVYSADFTRMRAVIDFLLQDCCRGLAPTTKKGKR
jgi:DNA-binding transcriptional ArsR family regulator